MSNDPGLDALRLPPHSIEAEQAVLGGLLLDNTAWDRVAALVYEHDFYREDHRRIFASIVAQIEATRPADVLTITEDLRQQGLLDTIGGMGYLASLTQSTPSAANIRRYADIVRERSVMRSLAQVGTEIADSAYSPAGRDARTLLDEAEAKVFKIAEAGARTEGGFQKLQPVLTQVIERIDMLYARDNPDDVTGVPTGFSDLDSMTSGLQPGDLVIVAGRPSMGKTAFALNVAEFVGLEKGLPVAVFSMEMAATQLAMLRLHQVGLQNQAKGLMQSFPPFLLLLLLLKQSLRVFDVRQTYLSVTISICGVKLLNWHVTSHPRGYHVLYCCCCCCCCCCALAQLRQCVPPARRLKV